jgi:hypothetical protein
VKSKKRTKRKKLKMSSKKDKSLYGAAKNPSDLAALTNDIIKDPPSELNERQRRVLNYRFRGLTQTAIAKLEDVSQPMIAKEIRTIKKIFAEQGRTIDQEQVVGESVSLYQEVEQRAWEIYFTHKKEKPSAANKALDTVMASREKTVKLLMDLGIMKKAAIEHEHTMKVAPFFEQFDSLEDQQKQNALRNVIDVHLGELEEPEPPQLLADIEPEEGEEDDTEE